MMLIKIRVREQKIAEKLFSDIPGTLSLMKCERCGDQLHAIKLKTPTGSYNSLYHCPPCNIYGHNSKTNSVLFLTEKGWKYRLERDGKN